MRSRQFTLSGKFLRSEYQLFKERAKTALSQNEVEKGLNLAMYCGLIAWQYPILYNFVDEELESILDKLASQLIKQNEAVKCPKCINRKKVVLYAGQIIDNGALTEQYLRFFIDNEYDVLLIVPSTRNVAFGKNTLDSLKNTPGLEIYISDATNLSEKIIDVYEKVLNYNPEKIFLHFLPNDVVGYCVFSSIRHITKFFIVHNDHTFWIGKGCSDYFIEFRKFGYLLALQRRRIPREQILLLPFYPINNGIAFQGFPFQRTNQVVGLSGAHLYKYLIDPQLKYFHAIKLLLRRNSNFVFCLCGNGDGIEKILDIFKEDDIKDRFFFLGKRNDFYSLVGNIDILFESYPLKGGLTALFAINQHKVLVGIGNPKDASGCIQDFFNLIGYKECLSIDEFLKEADTLIKDPDSRKKKVSIFSNHKFNKEDFYKGLSGILDGDTTSSVKIEEEPLELDDDSFLRGYLNLPDSGALYLKSKLFTLKKYLSLLERMICYHTLYSDWSYPLKEKKLSRLAFLVVFGR